MPSHALAEASKTLYRSFPIVSPQPKDSLDIRTPRMWHPFQSHCDPVPSTLPG